MADISSLPFPRKYRPTSLINYIGNQKNKETVMKVLQGNKRPQILMFVGSSGCGKTSLARLVGKEYNCLDRNDETGACGVCANCLAMDEYIVTSETDTLQNVTEVNVAEDSGKRDLDSVIEDMTIPAFGDEWKIYIFDEFHKASNSLQNRLLKITEEPPEHVLMIFCTTEPENVIPTLLNRMSLTLTIAKPTVKELAGLMRGICETEGMEYDVKGLEFIANRGELTTRTALQNLQRLQSMGVDATYASAVKVFEEISNTVYINFFKALKAKDVLSFVSLLGTVKEKMDLSVFLTELTNFVKRGIYTINGVNQEGIADGELKVYRDLFGDLGIAEISNLLSKILSISIGNVELNMLQWGYSGLITDTTVAKEVTIQSLDNELTKEQRHTNNIVKEHLDEEYQDGIENAEKLTEVATLDTLLGFGGILVE